MQKVSTIPSTAHYINCPHCHNSETQVDHLFSRFTGLPEKSFGPWYCDECGGAFRGKVIGDEVYVEVLSEQRKDSSLVFLRKENTIFVVKGMYFDGEINRDSQRFLYESHQCPTNYLQYIEMVIDMDSQDTDPHGIFEYVGTVPYVDLDEVDVFELIEKASKQE